MSNLQKHAKMLNYLANNPSYSMFEKQEGSDKWHLVHRFVDTLPFVRNASEYFLCHPIHTATCLAALNGRPVSFGKGESVATDHVWHPHSAFNFDSISITLHEENHHVDNWIAVNKKTGRLHTVVRKKKEDIVGEMVNPDDWIYTSIPAFYNGAGYELRPES